MRQKAILGLAALAVVACSYSQRKVSKLARQDLSCRDGEVRSIGDDNYEATGCGRKERYYCAPIYGKPGTPNENFAVDRECAPVSVAAPALRRARAQEDECDDRCSSAQRS